MYIRNLNQSKKKNQKETPFLNQNSDCLNINLKFSKNQLQNNDLILPRLNKNQLNFYGINPNKAKSRGISKSILQNYDERKVKKRQLEDKENPYLNNNNIYNQRHRKYSVHQGSMIIKQEKAVQQSKQAKSITYKSHSSSKFSYVKQINQSINYKFREKVINWLQSVCQLYQFKRQTFFLALQIFDSFNSIKMFDSSSRNTLINDAQLTAQRKIQFTMIVCLFIANKYEETISIGLTKFQKDFCRNYYSSKDIIDKEGLILNALQFNLIKLSPFNLACEVLSRVLHQQLYKLSIDLIFEFIKNQLKQQSVYQALYQQNNSTVKQNNENINAKIMLTNAAIFNYFDTKASHQQYQRNKIFIRKYIQDFRLKLDNKNYIKNRFLQQNDQQKREQLRQEPTQQFKFAFQPPTASFFNN